MEDMKFESLMPTPDAGEQLQQLENNVKKIATEMIELLQDHDTSCYGFCDNIKRLQNDICKQLRSPKDLLPAKGQIELKITLDNLYHDAMRTWERVKPKVHIKDVCVELYTLFDRLQPTRYLYNSLECYKKYMAFIEKAVKMSKATKRLVTLHIASAPHLTTETLHDIVTKVREAENLKVIYHFRYDWEKHFKLVMDEVHSAETEQNLTMREYFTRNEKHEIRIYFCRDKIVRYNVKRWHTLIEEIKEFTANKARNMKVWYYFQQYEFNMLMQAINNESRRGEHLFDNESEENRQHLREYFGTDKNHRINLVEEEAQYYFHTKWAAYSAAPDQRVKLLLTSANLTNDHLKSRVEGTRILNSMIEGTLPYRDFQARFLTPMTDGYETVMRTVTMSLDSTGRLGLTWPAGNYNDVQIYQQVKEFVKEAVLKSTTNPCVLHIVSPFVDYSTINQILLWSSTARLSGKLQVNITCKDQRKLKNLEAAIVDLNRLESELKSASAIVGSLKDFIKVLHDLKTPQDSQKTESLESLMKRLSLDTEQEDNIKLLQSVKVTHATDFHCKFIGYGPQASADESAGIHEKSDDESAGLAAAGSAAAGSAAAGSAAAGSTAGESAAGGSEAESAARSAAGIYEVLMTSANFNTDHMNASKEESKKWNDPGYANLDWTVRLKVTEQEWKFMIGLIEG